ncbi:hypothetical protein F4823DRAFT_232916 [Ustulina deusta]|nr:hypothetical protein F4823DRAFT_232916 [Ustulina deusta]
MVLSIPDAIASYLAAPMLCAGLTVWESLTQACIGPGYQVAIVSLGGLGALRRHIRERAWGRGDGHLSFA